jgi:hypothetical protein
MPRDGSLILSDVRGLTLSIVCEPCSRRGRCRVKKACGRADKVVSPFHQLSGTAINRRIRNLG